MKKVIYISIILLGGLLFNSCNLLDVKPVNSMLPVSVEDFESLLLGGYPSTDFFMKTDLATDNVYANLNCGRDPEKDLEPWFVWANTHQLADKEDTYWQQLYKSIFYANTVLDNFETRIPKPEEKSLMEMVRGEAYALRAYCYFYLVNLYAEPYAVENLDKPGVPMPLTAEDVHENTQNNIRVPVGKVWEQILKDLELATSDLSGKSSQGVYRFDYCTLQALKARVCLFMGKYDEAITAATDVISTKPLCDMNNFQAWIDEKGDKYAFSGNVGFIDSDYKNEVLFFVGGRANNNIFYYSTNMFKPVQELLDLCMRDPGVLDYRKYIFASFQEPGTTEGIQQGQTVYHMFATQEKYCHYIGFKVSEAYVTRAEAYARKKDKQKAVADLNKLLVTRVKTGQFVALDENDFNDEQLLKRVLEERRVELAFDGGLRWFDLRRLDKPEIVHSYKNAQVYTLQQDDLRYVLQIPQSEQENSPNMPLNPR